jgi:hypothetical protein
MIREKFGMDRAEYDGMLAAQGGVCKLCGKSPGTYRLAVDHCHRTGAVRALLCMGCNRSLGWVERIGLAAVSHYLHPIT